MIGKGESEKYVWLNRVRIGIHFTDDVSSTVRFFICYSVFTQTWDKSRVRLV